MGQKRKRLALSCVACRRRKIKCDRTLPVCERCQKSNNAEHCTYVPHTGLEPGLPTPSEDSPQQHHATQPQVVASGEPYVLAALREISPHLEVQSRAQPVSSNTARQELNTGMMHALFGSTARMETFTRSAGSRPLPAALFAGLDNAAKPHHEDQHNPASEFGKVLVRGKDFSTHYYGPSFAISMLLQFEELSRFVKGLLNHVPSLANLKEKMAATRAISKQLKRQSLVNGGVDMISMIPDRIEADKLVKQYLDLFETTYRVLHVPIFQQQYESFWQDPSAAKPGFLVVLLLVMACVYTIVPGGPPGFVGRSSARRDVASRWITVCEAWLEDQSHKHVSLEHFQALVLVLIAKGVNCIKIKREWTASGQLLRFAMAVGMHREPSVLSKKIDVFGQEMRRRLWHTIMELDLLTTIARGMPPTIDSYSWDCLPPRNIHDEDFDESTEQLPPSKSRTTFTRTSFLHIASESLPLRVEVLGRINSIRLALDLEAVMQYDSKLRMTIDDLPIWKSESYAAHAQNLSTLLLYEFVLILHVPFANSTHKKAKSFYSVASKRDISFKTLQMYANMSDLERLICTDTRDDACRAALAMSHDITTHMKTDVVPNHEQTLAYLEIVVNALAKRFETLGQGFHGFWITLSAYYLLKSKMFPSQSSEVCAREAADRVAELFQEMINNQVAMPLPNGDASVIDAEGITNAPTIESFESFDAAFPGFDQANFFDDPFSDMNFDLSNMWNPDGFQ